MNTISKLLGGALVATLGISCLLPHAAVAVTFSTSGPDILEYCSDGVNTFHDGQAGMTCNDPLATLLSGNSVAPGGNVELYDGTDGLPLLDPNWRLAATLEADFDGHIVTFSSITFDDWFGTGGGATDTSFGASNLANQWFADALTAYGASIRPLAATFGFTTDEAIYNAFLVGVNVPGGISIPLVPSSYGFQRISDPNVAYVNKDLLNHKIVFGLAGQQNAGDIFPAGSPYQILLQNAFASEVVKVTHDGVSEYFYSFSQPTDSGQVNKDGNSHTGNFEFMIDVAKVPEPSGLALVLAVVCGLAGVRRRGV